MTDKVYLNADKTAVVSEFAAGKKWQVPRAEAAKLGLLDTEKPTQQRRAPAASPAPVEKPKQRRRKRK